MFHNISRRSPLRRYYKINQAQSPLILSVHVIDLRYHLSRDDDVRSEDFSEICFVGGARLTQLKENVIPRWTSQATECPSALIRAYGCVNTPREIIIAADDELNHPLRSQSSRDDHELQKSFNSQKTRERRIKIIIPKASGQLNRVLL